MRANTVVYLTHWSLVSQQGNRMPLDARKTAAGSGEWKEADGFTLGQNLSQEIQLSIQILYFYFVLFPTFREKDETSPPSNRFLLRPHPAPRHLLRLPAGLLVSPGSLLSPAEEAEHLQSN